jgi:hypothetical protein
LQPLIRSLEGALCVEHQVQRLARGLQGRSDFTASARELITRIAEGSTRHIADLGSFMQTGIDLAARMADATPEWLDDSAVPPSVHLRELYGLLDQAALWYEALVLCATATGDDPLVDCSVGLLEECVHALGDLDVEIPSALLGELEDAGETLSEPLVDACMEQIATAWDVAADDEEAIAPQQH